MANDVRALARRIEALEDAVSILVKTLGVEDQVEGAKAARREDAQRRTAERNDAMSEATRAATEVNQRRGF
jgi:hypothetical protein